MMRHASVRLLSFHAQDEKVVDTFNKCVPPRFTVQMFGLNKKGETYCITVEDYEPFFYAKVPDEWTEKEKTEFIFQLKNDMKDETLSACITNVKFMQKKKLYGFDNNKEHKFLLIKFNNEQALRKAKNLWYGKRPHHPSGGSGSSGEEDHKLLPQGYHNTYLYEAQIPPLLRLFHIREISPSGWIALPQRKTTYLKNKKTSCTHECTISVRFIQPLKLKETMVPYKICSFDIEASSSHGDFPLPVKNYKKLATNLIDVCADEKAENINQDFLKHLILAAFGFVTTTFEVEKVYPITAVSQEIIEQIIDQWLGSSSRSKTEVVDEVPIFDEEASSGVSDVDGESDEDDAGAGAEEVSVPRWQLYKRKPKSYGKKNTTVVDLLTDPEATRETQLLELTKSLTACLPKLQGDNVTFIGSTFMRFGEERPYLNHCIVRDTCDSLENTVIESYPTERQVLLAWTELIQREDPDIIIGYNIFGFDYQFMYLRAKELKCEENFLKLSRNKKEICLSYNWKTKEKGLEESTIVIASGQHDLKYVKMTGRVQIDLYNYLRREYQLSQYKLDYVAGYFIGDYVTKIEHEHLPDAVAKTKIYSKNLTGLDDGVFVTFEEEAHSVDYYKNGKKFQVFQVDRVTNTFCIGGHESPDMKKKVKWGLAKDDVTPQDIFRMTKEGPKERALIAKYCIQDCNLVHHLIRKIDVITGFVEMASLCSVPLDFIIMRGQGIKLTSYIAKKCREKNILMPVLDKAADDEGYEGATVLEPKCSLYLNDPIACNDYSSLYPSSMISENISHDSKVLTREYDLAGTLIAETGESVVAADGGLLYIYDNLPGYTYVDIEYNTYKWQRKNGNAKAGMEKVKTGTKVCRFAQHGERVRAIMPAILEELLAARKATRALILTEKDDFMKNVLDKRQLSIKVTANSLYGQTGAKTSSFYEKDCAASTTAMGRKFLTYGKRVLEECYQNTVLPTTKHGLVRTNAEYVYGDTDSVFFKFNLTHPETGQPIIGQDALEITIELAQQVGQTASMFLKWPHYWEYEKTFLPFCLLSKKRYVGMLHEHDPTKSKRKSMGIVLKRRDNAPIVKDIYGGVIDILMKEKNVELAVSFLRSCLQNMVDETYPMEKLIITKSLRSGYKNPKQIAHKVLAERMGRRDAGNKPSNGDRIPFVFIENPNKKALQGERIETPEFIIAEHLKINYSFYITNQIMKPIQQLFALVLEQILAFRLKKGETLRKWRVDLATLRAQYPEEAQYRKKEEALRNKEVKALLFDPYLRQTDNMKAGNTCITEYFAAKK